jgi:hypothetical protein
MVDLVQLEPLVTGWVQDVLGGEGRVGKDEVSMCHDIGKPLAEHLLPHDLGAGAKVVQAREAQAPGT